MKGLFLTWFCISCTIFILSFQSINVDFYRYFDHLSNNLPHVEDLYMKFVTTFEDIRYLAYDAKNLSSILDYLRYFANSISLGFKAVGLVLLFPFELLSFFFKFVYAVFPIGMFGGAE